MNLPLSQSWPCLAWVAAPTGCVSATRPMTVTLALQSCW